MISTLSFGLEELGGGGEGHSYETVLQRRNLSDLTKATLLEVAELMFNVRMINPDSHNQIQTSQNLPVPVSAPGFMGWHFPGTS